MAIAKRVFLKIVAPESVKGDKKRGKELLLMHDLYFYTMTASTQTLPHPHTPFRVWNHPVKTPISMAFKTM